MINRQHVPRAARGPRQARKSCPPAPCSSADFPTFYLRLFLQRSDVPTFWSYPYTGTLPRLISFVCHSYENCRVCTKIPKKELAARDCVQVLSFHILAHSFARLQNSTLLFSIDSAFFAQNTGGWAGESVVFLKKNFKCSAVLTDSRPMPSLQTAQGASAITCSALTSSSPTN